MSIFDSSIVDYKPVAINATATLTTSQLAPGAFISSIPTAGTTLTTPTAAILAESNSDLGINQGFTFFVRNTAASALTVTMAGGANVTDVGTLTTAQNFISVFLLRRTSTTAFSLTRISTSAA